MDVILKILCAHHNVRMTDIKTNTRNEDVVFCRHMAGIVMAIGFDMTTENIAPYIGIKRAAVSLGIQRIIRLYRYNKAYKQRITSTLFVIVGGHREWADNISKTLRYIQCGESLRDKLCDLS